MNLAGKLTDKLVKMEIINNEDKGLYYYGFSQGFLLLLNMLTVIIVGIAFNMVWHSIIFMIAYSCLRVYAGGYHANTQSSCYFFSLIMIIAVLWIIKLVAWNGFLCVIITTISSLIILLMAPMEDGNKPLDQKEEKTFKKRTYIVLSILILFILFFWSKGTKQASICMMMGICVVSIMLILGKVKNEIKKYYYQFWK